MKRIFRSCTFTDLINSGFTVLQKECSSIRNCGFPRHFDESIDQLEVDRSLIFSMIQHSELS